MPRAGTTYLYHALSAHPGFQLPPRKELRYFSHHYLKGPDWYHRQFGQAPAGAVFADLSPDYFMHSGIASKLAAHSQTLQVAIAVRPVAEWAVSLHRHLRSFEPEIPVFADFLVRCRYPDFKWPGRKSNPCTLDLTTGFVRKRIEEFRTALGGRLLLYDFTAFERNPLSAVRWLEAFCSIPTALDAQTLPPHRINGRSASPRRPITYWMSREPVAEILSRVLPRGLIMDLRRRWERPGAAVAIAAEEARDVAFARDVLSEDQAYVDRLFTSEHALLGNGSPLTRKVDGAKSAN
jgi:hypothetical protein